MPPRGPEAAIAKFLRDALARDDLGVPTLEAMARGAGLLGENQRITNAKLRPKVGGAFSWTSFLYPTQHRPQRGFGLTASRGRVFMAFHPNATFRSTKFP
jgi:hypothetical protein